MNKSMPIAPKIKCLEHECMDAAYNIWKMVKAGETNVTIESIRFAKKCLEKIEEKLNGR